ncbi:hypothetical protein RDI58_024960 [Solanum bulbocastanum]|uniref:Uncharacterized protein n=1 Tax=Solanum bulbocastanum TaxID=147425 RepID=A0AAN8Y3X5_SOLBU
MEMESSSNLGENISYNVEDCPSALPSPSIHHSPGPSRVCRRGKVQGQPQHHHEWKRPVFNTKTSTLNVLFKIKIKASSKCDLYLDIRNGTLANQSCQSKIKL